MSDTHDNTANVHRIVDCLNAAGVSQVVHTGDITKARTLDVLAGLEAPLTGVFGNNDQERESLETAAARLGITLVDPPLTLSWAEREIAVVHDPAEIHDDLRRDHRVLLHGHTHRFTHHDDGRNLILNPGECAGHMRGYNTIGVLDLVSFDVELLRF
ncbi:MAG: YfcE family phosphodiesterase [Myxococcota bacterium]|nr:YfcE family phosphodiesterase [Myxococcota bacterium]